MNEWLLLLGIIMALLSLVGVVGALTPANDSTFSELFPECPYCGKETVGPNAICTNVTCEDYWELSP